MRTTSEFKRLWISTGSANLSDGILLAGLPVLAATATRSPIAISLVQVAVMIPVVVSALPSGALADRADRVHLMIVANGARAVGLAAVAILAAATNWVLAAVYLAAIAASSGETLADSAAESHVPSLVDDNDLDGAHARLVGTQTLFNNGIGAPAGAALATVGATALFAVPAALFALASLTARRLTRIAAVPVADKATSVGNDVRAGLSYVWQHPTLKRLAIANAIANFGSAAFFAIAVLIFTDLFDISSRWFGVVLVLLAAGGTIGAVVAEPITARIGRHRILSIGPIAAGAAYATILIGIEPISSAVALFMLGATGMLWNVANRVVRQRQTPNHLLGRIKATMALIAVIASPLGAVTGGFAAQLYGLRSVLAITTAASILSWIIIRQVPTNSERANDLSA